MILNNEFLGDMNVLFSGLDQRGSRGTRGWTGVIWDVFFWSLVSFGH